MQNDYVNGKSHTSLLSAMNLLRETVLSSDLETDLDDLNLENGYFDDGCFHSDLEIDLLECLTDPAKWDNELGEDSVDEDLIEEDTVEIRNFIDGNYYRVHNKLLEKDGVGPKIGPYGIAVYSYIARACRQQDATSSSQLSDYCQRNRDGAQHSHPKRARARSLGHDSRRASLQRS